MKTAHRPATTRSAERRLGDRFRDRLRISSWCLASTDLATTERAPPGPASRATVVSRCKNRMARSRTAGSYQDRDTRKECSGIWNSLGHKTTLQVDAASVSYAETAQDCEHNVAFPLRTYKVRRNVGGNVPLHSAVCTATTLDRASGWPRRSSSSRRRQPAPKHSSPSHSFCPAPKDRSPRSPLI